MTLGNMRQPGVIATTMALSWTTAFAFSPSDCGIESGSNASGLRQYCATLRREMIAADPGGGLIGKLDKADPISGEPASQHYYWIVTPDGQTYFDGSSAIGRKILKVCKVGRLCAVKVGVEKSWEHNVDHATFWITKIIGDPIGE
jgi:hypothetical protein